MHRREALIWLTTAVAGLVTACVTQPSPSPARTIEPAQPLDRLGPYELMNDAEKAAFLSEIQAGAYDELSQQAAAKIGGLQSGAIKANVELSRYAQDPLHLYVTSVNAESYFEPLHLAPVDRYVQPLDEPTPRPLYNGLRVGIGMPVRSPSWSDTPQFVKAMVATKELVGLGIVDEFSRWRYQMLKEQGHQYSIVNVQGQILSSPDQLSDEDIVQIGNFYFFQDIGTDKQLRGVLWRLKDLMPALVVASGWQKKLDAGELAPGAELKTPATFVLLADRAKKTPYGQTSILDHVYNTAFIPMVNAQNVRGDTGRIASLLSTPEISNLILEVSALPQVYGPIP